MSPIDDHLVGAVGRLMRDVAADIVLPRFRALADGDVIEKAPGDFVTIADRLSEEALGRGLGKILPAARMIGEEAVAADPALIERVHEGLAWIVDPIDGTNNYAEGKTPFAIMVALVDDGEALAGWILDPSSGRLCHAVRGGGAFVDGTPLRSRPTGAALPVAALASQFLPPDVRERLSGRITGRLREVPVPRCAGEQYPRVMLGENDAALFWRAYPWDHVPGALILTEAGGRIARFDGSPYLLSEPGFGLLAAATPALWDQIRAILFD